MQVVLSKYAKLELDNAVAFYNIEQKGLGNLFKEEIKSSFRLISRHPVLWSEITSDIRKFVLHKFPYKILYSVKNDHILVLAIAHQHQKPDYWVDRE